MKERMRSEGYVIPKCWGFKDRLSKEYVVKGVRNRREHAITGRDARDSSGRIGADGKFSYIALLKLIRIRSRGYETYYSRPKNVEREGK